MDEHITQPNVKKDKSKDEPEQQQQKPTAIDKWKARINAYKNPAGSTKKK